MTRHDSAQLYSSLQSCGPSTVLAGCPKRASRLLFVRATKPSAVQPSLAVALLLFLPFLGVLWVEWGATARPHTLSTGQRCDVAVAGWASGQVCSR